MTTDDENIKDVLSDKDPEEFDDTNLLDRAEGRSMIKARLAYMEASPFVNTPWIVRLLARAVQETIESVRELLYEVPAAEVDQTHVEEYWMVRWTKDGKRVSAVFNIESKEESLLRQCEDMARWESKRPVVLERVKIVRIIK